MHAIAELRALKIETLFKIWAPMNRKNRALTVITPQESDMHSIAEIRNLKV